jgi:imidazolonepropionase
MLLLRNIAQIVTLARGPVPRVGNSMSELGVIENGAILIRGDRIVWVGPTKNLPVREPGIRYQTLDGVGLDLVAMPGFVDSHTHPIFGSTRVQEYEMRVQGKSREETATGDGGISSSIGSLRAATMNQLLEKAERHFRNFLSHGTTTIEAKCGYDLSAEDELKSLHVLSALRERSRLEIVPTFMSTPAIPEGYPGSRAEYLREIAEKIIPQVSGEGLAQFCDVFCENGCFTVEEARHVLGAAKEAGLGLRIHADERTHSGGARLAAELGARSADHLQYIDDADIEVLRQAGTVATLLPGTAFNMGMMRYAPARKLIAAGVPVALGTDSGICLHPDADESRRGHNGCNHQQRLLTRDFPQIGKPAGGQTGRHHSNGCFGLSRIALLFWHQSLRRDDQKRKHSHQSIGTALSQIEERVSTAPRA